MEEVVMSMLDNNGNVAELTRRDIEILEGSTNRTVRDDPVNDAAVKKLFKTFNSL
jgi:hypothetical protein